MADDNVTDDQTVDTQDDAAVDTSTQADDTQAADTAPVEEAIVELEGVKYTPSEIQEALEIKSNQAAFTTKNQEEAQRLNVLSGVIEEARLALSGPRPANTSNVPTPNGANAPTAEQFQQMLLSDNPGEAMAYLANFIQESVTTQTTEAQAKTAFETAHPDYNQVINSPEYRAYKAGSPLGAYMNDLNGFLSYKLSVSGDATKTAAAEAIKEGEKIAAANAKAKANLKIINSGGGTSPPAATKITPESSPGEIENAAVAAIVQGRSG